jgi:hypothetical protein
MSRSISRYACISLAVGAASALTAATAASATFAQDAVPATMPEVDPGLEADVALLARLDVPFAEPISFDDAPVGEVLERVQKESGLRLVPDRHVLSDGGGWKLKSVTTVAPTPRVALDAMVRSLGEGLDGVHLDVASGVLVLTDNDGLRSLRATRMYRVGDIVRALLPVETNDGVERGGGQNVVPLDPRIAAPDARLLDTIMTAIDPEIWEWAGGDLASAELAGDALVVKATPAVHRKVEQLLTQLRAATPTDPILWSVTIVELPADIAPGAERDLLGRIAGGVEGGRKDQVPGARIVSQPKILSQPTEVATFAIGDETEGWTLEIHPSCDQGRCTYAIEVGHRAGSGADGRTTRIALHAQVGTAAATVFSTNNAGAKDAAGAAAQTGRRFLVEIHGRRQPSKAPEAAAMPPAAPAADGR